MVKEILGLENDKVRLMPYQTAWEDLYLQEAAWLHDALGAMALDVQHIGSTSVPGLSAKPMLDIGIAVRDFDEAFSTVEPLERLGYIFRGEKGVPRRHYFVKGPPERRTHHLHMLEQTSDEWYNLLRFRDFLRENPKAVKAYGTLKTGLAQTFLDDREAYMKGKHNFIQRILKAAREP